MPSMVRPPTASRSTAPSLTLTEPTCISPKDLTLISPGALVSRSTLPATSRITGNCSVLVGSDGFLNMPPVAVRDKSKLVLKVTSLATWRAPPESNSTGRSKVMTGLAGSAGSASTVRVSRERTINDSSTIGSLSSFFNAARAAKASLEKVRLPVLMISKGALGMIMKESIASASMVILASSRVRGSILLVIKRALNSRFLSASFFNPVIKLESKRVSRG